MTADWYLFWSQHYARPIVSEFDLELGIVAYGMDVMGKYFAQHFVPAFTKMTQNMARALTNAA